MVICDRCSGSKTWQRITSINIVISNTDEETSPVLVTGDFCKECVDIIRKAILEAVKPEVKVAPITYSLGDIDKAVKTAGLSDEKLNEIKENLF